MQHTPTPWRAADSDEHGYSVEADELYGVLSWQGIAGADGEIVALALEEGGFSTPTMDANISFIVRACNAHDQLVAACRAYVAAAKSGDSTLDCFKQIEAALTMAEATQ
jgi:hypothetical protein